MSKFCVFCDIVETERYEVEIVSDEATSIVIVPLDPVTPGHLLVIPKQHVMDALEDPVVTGAVFRVAAAWAKQTYVGPCTLITSAGWAATQSIMHLHCHIIPRHEGDGLALPWSRYEA